MRRPAGDEDEAISSAGEIDALNALYSARIELARRTAPKAERAAAIRALDAERKAAIREVTERRRQTSAARRTSSLERRPPRADPPQK